MRYVNPTLVFIAQFTQIFFVGLQQMNVHRNRQLAAFFTSLCIGTCSLASAIIVVRNGGVAESIAYLAGGPLGIVASMKVYRKQGS